jgi:hypothetical protein
VEMNVWKMLFQVKVFRFLPALEGVKNCFQKKDMYPAVQKPPGVVIVGGAATLFI